MGLPFGQDSWLNFRFASKVPYYYVGLAMMVGIYLIMKKIDRSKMGFALKTIREDEDAAAAIGINPTKYKIMAVVISLWWRAWWASSMPAISAISIRT